ncbi:beta strand repeat-containing protein, partial [Leucothrix arctica]
MTYGTAPVAVDDSAANVGVPSPTNPTTLPLVGGNDSDADGTIDPATVDLNPTAAGIDTSFTNSDGTYVVDAAGNVTFTPNATLTGNPTPIAYTVNDNDGNTSNEATLTITYGTAPVAVDDSAANLGVPSPTNPTTLATIGTNDSDPDGTINAATVDLDPTTEGVDSSFTNGDGTYVVDAVGNVIFTPNAALIGNPTPITYTVNDNDGNASNEATLTVTYGTAPVAVDDLETNPDIPSPTNPTTLVLVGGNDSDSDGTIDPATVDLDPTTVGIDASFTNGDGTYVVDTAGNVTFTPNTILSASPTPIAYTVNDNDGNTSNEATLTIAYGNEPVAMDDTATNLGVPSPTNPTILPLVGRNDSDPDGTIDQETVDLDPTTAGIDASFTNSDGTYEVDAVGNVTFTPSATLTGNPAPITYTVNDNDGNTSNEATLTVIYGTAPVAVDDSAMNLGVPSSTNPTILPLVGSNDSDPDGTIHPATVDLDPITAGIDASFTNSDGTYAVDAVGNVTFTPNATLIGNPTPIAYTVNDNDGNMSNEATLTVTYGVAPAAVDDSAANLGTPSPDNSTTLPLVGSNDSDFDGTIDPATVDLDPTTPGIDSTFTNVDGTYAVDTAGNVTFTPSATLTGSPASITYTVDDNDGNTSNEASLMIAYGNEPVAMDDMAANLGVPSPANPTTLPLVSSNDSDPDGTIDPATVDLDPTTSGVDATFTNGDGTYVVDATGNVTFTPNATLAGNPTPISYTVNDNDGNISNEALLTVTYGVAPIAVDDLATNPGTPSPTNPTTLISVGGNDSDSDGTIDPATVDLDPTTPVIDSTFNNGDGTYAVDAAGNVIFTPSATLTDSPTPIAYTVNDNDGNTSNEATLSIAYGNEPVAMDDTAANLGTPSPTNPTKLPLIGSNDSDPDGTIDPATVDLDPKTVGIDASFTNSDGTYVVDAAGNVTFTPSATLTGNPTPITYTVNDNDGNTSNEATLTVTYGTAPVAVDDSVANPGVPSPINPTTLPLVGSNDSDPDGSIDTSTVDLDPTTPWVDTTLINADGTYNVDELGNVIFTPNAVLTGNPATITYTVNDNDGNTSNEATLTIAYGTAPVAVDDSETNSGAPSTTNPTTLVLVGDNDSDPDGTIDPSTVDLDPTTPSIDSAFTNGDGTYAVDAMGNVTFTPNATLSASPTVIAYTVNDNDGNTSNEAALTIAYGNEPVAMDDTATNLGVPSPTNPTILTLVGSNDSDPDGTIDPATVDLDPTTLTIDASFTNADGTYTVDVAGNVMFTPSATLTGNPTPIAYTVNDNDGNTSNEASLTVTYGTAPVAVDDLATNPGTPSSTNPTILVLVGGNDSDSDGTIDPATVDLDPTTPSIDSTFTNGDGIYAVDAAGNVTFTPNATLISNPTPIAYTVNDNDGNTSNEATLTIAYGNEPVAMNDTATNLGIPSPTNPTLLQLVGGNDSDLDGTIDPATIDLDPTTSAIETSFTNADGNYVVDAAGNVTFTPSAALTSNPASITYTVNDNDGNTSNEATLTVTYGTAPIAVDDSEANLGVPSPTNPTTLSLVGSNDSDPDGTIDSATVDLDPTTPSFDASFTNGEGTYVVDSAGDVTFTPNAILSGNPTPITYTVNDNDGNTSNEATLTVTYGVAPLAVDDLATNPGAPSPTNPTTLLLVGGNDSDPDGTIDPATVDLDPTTPSIDSTFTNGDGTYAVDATGNVTFTPSATLTGSPASITYTVNDNDGNTSNEASLMIAYGNEPVAMDDTATNLGVPSPTNPTTLPLVSSNDSDPDGTIDPATVDL